MEAWKLEYLRALEKSDMEEDEAINIVGIATAVVNRLPQPYKGRVTRWLNQQGRDDFMSSGGIWEDLLLTTFRGEFI